MWRKLIVRLLYGLSALAVSVDISPPIISAGVSVSTRAVYTDISVNYRNTVVLSRASLLYHRQNRTVPQRPAFITHSPTTNNTLNPQDVSLLSFNDTSGYCSLFVPLCHLSVLHWFLLSNHIWNSTIRLHSPPLCLKRFTTHVIKPDFFINLFDAACQGDMREQEGSCRGGRFNSFICDCCADNGVKGNTIVIHRHTKATQTSKRHD